MNTSVTINDQEYFIADLICKKYNLNKEQFLYIYSKLENHPEFSTVLKIGNTRLFTAKQVGIIAKEIQKHSI